MTSSFTRRIRPHVQRELEAAAQAEAAGRFATASTHLERAHVLGQTSTIEHLRVHWRMFSLARRNQWTGSAAGQLWRLVAAAVFTPLGLVPQGNTGWSDVSGFRRMSIAPELQRLIDRARRPPAAASAARRSALTGITALIAIPAAVLMITACASPPQQLDLALDKPTAAGLYRVALVPPAVPPAINQLHSWTLRVATPAGEPVRELRFGVDGGMPQHGHGLPTQPRVSPPLADGSYRIDGMKFSMTGWWELKLAVDGPLGADKVSFNMVVDAPAVRP
jgi:Protein of unknown function (DUF3703)/YtkA-like